MNSDEVQRSSLVESVVQPESPGWSSSLFSNTLFLLIIDVLLGALAYALAWLIRIYVPFPLTQDLLPQERWDAVNHLWGILLVSQGFFLYIFGMYDDLRVLRYREVLGHIVTACFGQVVVVTSVFYMTNGIFPRSVILVFGLVNVAVLTVWRAYVKSCLHADTLRVLLVAEDLESADEMAREIDRNPWMGLKIIGLVTASEVAVAGREAGFVPVLGSLEDTAEVIAGHRIDEVIFASRDSWKDRVLNSLSQLQLARPLRIAIRPSVFEIAIGRLRHINIYDTPLIEVRRNPNEPLSRLVKRSFDLMIAASFLVLLSPVILFISVAIIVSSPGSIFYLQDRVGLGGKTFRLIKFRTMIPEAEAASEEILAEKGDPRVTRIGAVLRRFRLDEIPQFVNVLMGDMSFVGPRPERPGFVRQFTQELPGYSERHKVKPGMTGLAQVRGFYDTAAENKLRYDLAYIYNYSFSLDLLILLETIKVILIRRGS